MLEQCFHVAPKAFLEQGHFINTEEKNPLSDISNCSLIANRAETKSQEKNFEAILERHFHGASKIVLEEGHFAIRSY